uniref:Scaffolding anchor of CK1 domain-containing protein n=1 Tax=Sinocyclocheilus grahami TaxID=75366 RepID=A0A672SX19_SINGR
RNRSIVQCYLMPKLMGKIKRRVREMRNPNAMVSSVDLSHNESTRLAMDALLDRGTDGYQEVLIKENEANFLSAQEKTYILNNIKKPLTDREEADRDEGISSSPSVSSETYFPAVTESEPPLLDYGWPVADWSYHLQGKFTFGNNAVFRQISNTPIFHCSMEALPKLTLLVEPMHFHRLLFMQKLHLLLSLTFECFSLMTLLLCHSLTWLSWQVHRSLAILFKGSGVKPFDLEFHRLYATSKPVPGFTCHTSDPGDLCLPIEKLQIPMGPAVTAGNTPDHLQQKPRQPRNPSFPTTQVLARQTSYPNVTTGPQISQWLPRRNTIHHPIARQSPDFNTKSQTWRPKQVSSCSLVWSLFHHLSSKSLI